MKLARCPEQMRERESEELGYEEIHGLVEQDKRPETHSYRDMLDDCEGRLSELLIDSATDESEANSPIKMTPQDDKGEVVYLSRTRRGTMRS